MQLSFTIHICSQIVLIEHKKSFFQPSVSDAHSKACNGMKTHAFSTSKSGNGAGISRMRSASTRLSARTHLPHVSLLPSPAREGRQRATNRASQSQVLLPHFLSFLSLTLHSTRLGALRSYCPQAYRAAPQTPHLPPLFTS